MRVYDPYAHTWVDLSEAVVEPAQGDYEAVLSETGRWFALRVETNTSLPLEKLTETERRLVENVANASNLRRDLIRACEHPSEGDLTESEDGARRAIIDHYGAHAAVRAITEVRSLYLASRVRRALSDVACGRHGQSLTELGESA